MITAIDLFAGSGGFSTGAVQAGVNVLWAANHWSLAVECHERNHPGTEHQCQDLHQANWMQVPKSDIVLASPCCQGHSKSRGKEKPHHDESRSTAWAVVSCCEFHRPQAFIVENVVEFLDWSLYPAWKSAMELLGYTMTTNVLDAAEFGTPQNRVRLLIVGSLGRPITLRSPQLPEIAVNDILDWDLGRWSPVVKKGRAPATLLRVENGRRQFGDRFIMPYYSSGSGLTGRALDRPVGTIPCTDRWAMVDGGRMRMFSVEEYRRAMGFPAEYWLPKSKKHAVKLLGNAVPPPLAEHAVRQVAAAISGEARMAA